MLYSHFSGLHIYRLVFDSCKELKDKIDYFDLYLHDLILHILPLNFISPFLILIKNILKVLLHQIIIAIMESCENILVAVARKMVVVKEKASLFITRAY